MGREASVLATFRVEPELLIRILGNEPFPVGRNLRHLDCAFRRDGPRRIAIYFLNPSANTLAWRSAIECNVLATGPVRGTFACDVIMRDLLRVTRPNWYVIKLCFLIRFWLVGKSNLLKQCRR
jgi:hypothetical protein